MNIFVAGGRGYIGRYFIDAALRAGHEITEERDASFYVHLGWRHLPNYESEVHYENVWPIISTLKKWHAKGVPMMVAGTCLERVSEPPHYGKAKLIVMKEAVSMGAQWLQIYNVWGGDTEKSDRLVPSLWMAMERGWKTFSVIDGVRDFVHVRSVAAQMLQIIRTTTKGGIYTISSGCPQEVACFCRQIAQGNPIAIKVDRPRPAYEPREMIGPPRDNPCFVP